MRTRVSLPERSVTCCASDARVIRPESEAKRKPKSGRPPVDPDTYDESVVEGGEDVGDSEDVLALAHGRPERDVLLLGLPNLSLRLRRRKKITRKRALSAKTPGN